MPANAWIQFFRILACLGLLGVVIQGILALLGADHGDMDIAHGGDGVHIFSVSSICAFLIGFGSVGSLLLGKAYSILMSSLGGVVAGVLGASLVIFLSMRLRNMGSDGTFQIENAVGQDATVYIRILAKRGSGGQVQLKAQGRYVTLKAITDENQDLASGSLVRVEKVVGSNTVQVTSIKGKE